MSTDDEDTPHSLWDLLGYYIDCAFAMFGKPAVLAATGWAQRWEHAHTLTWLRKLEEMMRKLLFIEALALALPAAPVRHAIPRARLRRLVAFHADKPQDWRVSFKLCASPLRPAPCKSGRAQTARSAQLCNTWPAALRLEALIRAYDNPAPLVRRIARLLRRRPEAARVFTAAPANPTAHDYSVVQAAKLAKAAKANGFPDSS